MFDFDSLETPDAELVEKEHIAKLETRQVSEAAMVKKEEVGCETMYTTPEQESCSLMPKEKVVLDQDVEEEVATPVDLGSLDTDSAVVASNTKLVVSLQAAAVGHQEDFVVAQERHKLFPLPDMEDGEQRLDEIGTGIGVLLKPIRELQTKQVMEKLRLYDVSRAYPRPEDARHAHRDGYECFLLCEAVRVIRDVYRRCATRADEGKLWIIEGGADSGGLIVRKTKEMSSEAFRERLSTGSCVEEVEAYGERLHYNLVAGTGPPSGWITSRNLPGEDVPAKHLATRIGCSGEVVVNGQGRMARNLIIISLMAVHIGNKDRLCRFQHVLQSIAEQRFERNHAAFVMAFSWSATTSELEARVREVINEFMRTQGTDMVIVAAEHRERQSQFQHMRAALAAAEKGIRRQLVQNGSLPSCWVIFGDDDDLWHPERVATYVNAIRAHTNLDGVSVFATAQRVNCRENTRIHHHEMPTKHHHVDSFILSGRGIRMDERDAARAWLRKLKTAGTAAATLPAPDELGMEYFHLCPRLRIVHEFFEVTPPTIIQHRYCDLRFCSFLIEYPRKGREMGLEVSWFEAECWMYFYACAGGEAGTWHATLDESDDELNDFPPETIGTEGHMALEVHVEKAEIELANKTHIEFKAYQPDITLSRLTKYWAGVRNYMELALVPRHKATIDQRVFDGFVFNAVNTSFGSFTTAVLGMEAAKSARAAKMMFKQGQSFAKSMARKFGVDVYWHWPGQFIEPGDVMPPATVDPAYAAPLVGNWAPKSTPKGYSQNQIVPKFSFANHYASQKSHWTKGRGKNAGQLAQKGFWNASPPHGFAHAGKSAGRGVGKSSPLFLYR